MLYVDEEQLELFDEKRWPRKPYCTDALEAGLKVRSLKSALQRAYVQANPPHLRVWSIFDIDRPGGGGAWEDANLPPPSWTTINKKNGHAHSVWGLRAPVLVDGLGARDAPLRYLCAVESLMREKLQADVGYAGLITKNPAHPLWHTLRGPRLAYDLSELAEYLPGLEKHCTRKRVEEVGLGRNVTLFDQTRRWAYKGIRGYWGSGLQGWNRWLNAVNLKALTYNGDFKTPLQGNEVWHIAKSVAKWTWRNTTANGFSEWQSVQAQKALKKRWGDNEDKQASARLMKAAGKSSREIARALDVNQSTVVRWIRD